MRKIDRHHANLAALGARYVPRQVEVDNMVDLFWRVAKEDGVSSSGRVGIRADYAPGKEPDVNLGKLPFRPNMEPREAIAFGRAALARGLRVLVCETFPPEANIANFAVVRHDADTVLVVASVARTTQRDMDLHVDKTRTFAVGDAVAIVHNDEVIRCVDMAVARFFYRADIAARARFLVNYPGEVSASYIGGRLLVW